MKLHELRRMVERTIREERVRETINRGRRYQFLNLQESTITKILAEEDRMGEPVEIMNAAGSPPVTLVAVSYTHLTLPTS